MFKLGVFSSWFFCMILAVSGAHSSGLFSQLSGQLVPCSAPSCGSVIGLKSCLVSPASNFQQFMRPDLLQGSRAMAAFQNFVTKHPNCYTRFCKRVCANTANPNRIKKMRRVCQEPGYNRNLIKLFCSECAAYMDESVLAECRLTKRERRNQRNQDVGKLRHSMEKEMSRAERRSLHRRTSAPSRLRDDFDSYPTTRRSSEDDLDDELGEEDAEFE